MSPKFKKKVKIKMPFLIDGFFVYLDDNPLHCDERMKWLVVMHMENTRGYPVFYSRCGRTWQRFLGNRTGIFHFRFLFFELYEIQQI